MPAHVDERLWNRAKQSAADQGRAKDWRYVMGIYQKMVKARDKVSGGLADGRPDNEFERDALAEGATVEREHTSDRSVAKEIAKDHLTENPRYYRLLRRMEKALIDGLRKSGMRPPGSGWSAPTAGHTGWWKVIGNHRIYWYPQEGIVGHDRMPLPEVPKHEAADHARDVDWLDEVHRAKVLSERVLADAGEAAPEPLKRDLNHRDKIEAIKRKIARSKSVIEIHDLQEHARDIGRKAGDAARQWEIRQPRLFGSAPDEPEAVELTPEQVRQHGAAAHKHGSSKDPRHFSKYMDGIVDRHGPREAQKVMHEVRSLQERQRGKATAAGGPAMAAKPVASRPIVPVQQMSMFLSLARPVLRLLLQKARRLDPRQVSLFDRPTPTPTPTKPTEHRPPGGGWMPIPHGMHGGFRRRTGDGWEYWYPGHGIQAEPHHAEPEAVHAEHRQPVVAQPEPAHEAVKPVERPVAQVPEKTPAERPRLTVRARKIAAKHVPAGAEIETSGERQYETAGKKIGGSRADLANMSAEELERNPELAKKLVTRSNVLGRWTPQHAEIDRAA